MGSGQDWRPVERVCTRSAALASTPFFSRRAGKSGGHPAVCCQRCGERRTGQRRPGGRARRFPWLSSSGPPGSAAPRQVALEQRPALAPRGPRARWCGSVAGTAQAGARRLLVPGESSGLARGVHCRHALRAFRPPLAPTLSSAAISPREVVRCGASSPTRSPHAAVSALSPACQRSVAGAVWHGRPSCTLGCHSGSAGLPAHCWGSWGRCPQTPGRRSPSRVGVGGEVEGRHCGAVQGRRAARGSLA